MISQDVWRRLQAPGARRGSNQPCLLDDDVTVRYVESGAVAVYCVKCSAGKVDGPRRFLGKLGSGTALFSVRLEQPDGLRFLFVPTEETFLREVPLQALVAEGARGEAPVGTLLDAWVRFLIDTLTGFAPPKLSTKLDERHELELEEGEFVAATRGSVRWIEVQEGSLHTFGAPNLEVTPKQAPFPLTDALWARAAGATRIASHRSEEILDAGRLENGLWRLHMLVLRLLDARNREEAAKEIERLRERERVQAGRTRAAIQSLAAVLDPRTARAMRGAGTETDPLLVAMRALGEHVGIEIRKASSWEGSAGGTDPIEAIARASQIRIRRVVLTGKWWASDSGSLLGFLAGEPRRPVALLRTRRRYVLLDPADGSRRRVGRKVAATLRPGAVMLYRRLPDGKLNLFDLVKFGLRGRRLDFGMVLGIGGLVTLLGMIVPLATAKLMDFAIPDADRRLLFEIGAGLFAAAVGQVVFKLAQGLYLLRVQMGSESESQAAVWDRLLRMRPSFFRRFSSGDLQSRVMAINQIGNQLSGATLNSLFSGVMALLNLGLLYYYSPQLSLIAVGLGLMVTAVTSVVSYFIRRNTKELLEIQGQRYGLEIQLIDGVGKLRVGGAGDRAFNHWMKSYSRQMDLWSRNFGMQDGIGLFNELIPTLSSMLLFFFAFSLLQPEGGAAGSGLSLGVFLAFSAAYGAFLAGITTLAGTAVGFMDILVRGRRVKPILEEEPEIDEGKADPGRLTGQLELKDVVFRYDADGPDVLKGVSIRAEPGEFVAVVGPSGSGKSTVMRLLLGFESPHSGTVSYDGQDLASLDVLGVRRQLGVVLQGGHLDSGTVFENISCGSPIRLDQAWAAAEAAGLGDDIRSMPMGMHTILSVGGGNVSGGQRQRMLIARALVHRPKLLLFDEATSALDNRTQAIVSESLERLHVTRIVIAHRLSTIRSADRIYVIEAGRVVQHGKYEDLIADEDGLFARMMQRQMA